MSADTLISRIQGEAEREIKEIQKEAKQEVTNIIQEVTARAHHEAEKILEQGRLQSNNEYKIQISRAHQEVNKEIMNAKEAIIDDCFAQAHTKLSHLSSSAYKKISTSLFKLGKQRLPDAQEVYISRDEDMVLAKDAGVTVAGKTQASGGIRIQSKDGKLVLDFTFEGILKRKKQQIRIEVGKLLFSKK